MTGTEFLASYPAKLMEYALAIGYLVLFIPFWRYVHGARKARKPATRTERAPVGVVEATAS
jgi:hypothetical protein